ncbi:MAG: glycosyltransferase family 2 protein, partial [Bacteroidales bacterium]
LTMPYMFFFELLAPIIELIGIIVLLYLIFIGGVNWHMAILLFLAIFSFNILVTAVIFFYDWLIGGSYSKKRHYLILFLASLFEPFLYHPFIVLFSIKGYLDFFFRTKASWGVMTRTGFGKKVKQEA